MSRQPAFTLWPWKVLSLAVPGMALCAAGLAAQNGARVEDPFVIFFSIVAGGNAYLFAMAIGDFGRSVIAIPIGAWAGLIAVTLFSFPIPNVLFLVILGIIVFISIFARETRVLPGVCILGMLVCLTLPAFERNQCNPTLSILSSYPFVCSCIAACMPLERTIEGIFIAGVTGARAALHGLLAGALVALIVLPVVLVFFRNIRPESTIRLFMVFPVLAANYFCVKYIFTAVHRVEAPVPYQSSETISDIDVTEKTGGIKSEASHES